MTSVLYRTIRRCPASRADGEPCQNYKQWGEDFCGVHLGRHATGPRSRLPSRVVVFRAAVPTCRCDAIPDYPHRPGGTPCRWPEGFAEPEAVLVPRVRPAGRVTRAELLRHMWV